MLAFPMDVASYAGQGEFGPLKRAALEVKVQIGIRLIAERNDSMHSGGRRAREAVRFNGAGDLRTNGPRNDLRLCRAEAVCQVDFLCRKIYAEAVSAHVLGPSLRLRVREQQEVIAVFEGGLEGTD